MGKWGVSESIHNSFSYKELSMTTQKFAAPLLLAVSLLLAASCKLPGATSSGGGDTSANAPSFIQVGKAYNKPDSSLENFTVLAIDSHGWVQIKTATGQVLWLNLSASTFLVEVPSSN